MSKYFEYRVKVIFKEIVIDGPSRKRWYFAFRIEFQIRGSPHIDSSLWIVNSPTLTKDNKEDNLAFFDNVVDALLPHETEQPGMYELVTTYQLHRHSKTCRKCKNRSCQFQYERLKTEGKYLLR